MIGYGSAFGITLFCLIILLALTFVISEYDIMHPMVIMTTTMTISLALAYSKAEAWHLHFSISAGLVLLTLLLVFCIGCLWGDWYLKGNTHSQSVGLRPIKRPLMMSWIILGAGICIMIVLAIVQFYTVYETALKLGNTGGYATMIGTVRSAQEHGGGKIFSRWYTYREIFASSFTYVSLYVFAYNCFYVGGQSILKNLKYLSTIVFYMPFLILSGGRLGLLVLIVYCAITGAILYQKNNNFNFNSKKKTIFILVGAGILFIFFFLGFGLFTGKVTIGGRSPVDIIAHYGGLSMPAFSVYLDSVHLEVPSVGNSTLTDFTRKLNYLGFNLAPSTTFLKFTQFYGIDTNVYTAMRRYIDDYGFVGMYIIMCLMGMAYTSFYDIIKFRAKNSVWIAIYALTVLPLFISTNDDIFLSRNLDFALYYNLGLVYLMHRFCLNEGI